MATIKIGSSTTFNFTIPLDKPITEYVNIFASLYTDANKPVRFSYLEKDGFEKLVEGETTSELVGILTSANTSKMRGCLFMVVKAIETIGADENIGNSIPTKVTDAMGREIELVYSPLSETV